MKNYNFPFQVGSIVIGRRSPLFEGKIGVVYNKYSTGFQVIFENGFYDGFGEFPMLHPDGSYQSEIQYYIVPFCKTGPNSDYLFIGSVHLHHDYNNGKFKESFEYVHKNIFSE